MQITDRRHFVQIGHYESKSKQASRTLMPLSHLIKVIIIPPSHPGSVHVQIHQVLKKKKSFNFVFGCCSWLSDLGVYLSLSLF